jgi:starch-binding outer membrane protein, SusD/RagB family
MRTVLLCAALTAACSTDALLDVDQPDIIDATDLGGAYGAAALYAGALGDFAVAHDGGNGGGAGLGLVIATGFMSDEFRFGGSLPDVREMDLRSVREANTAWALTYSDQHRARAAAERAAAALKAVATEPDARIGEMYALVAAEIILLGEAYCSGAPLGTTIPTLTYGAPQSTTQLMLTAIAKLDQAAPHVLQPEAARIANFVAVLRGRALLNMASYADAANAVSGVPTSFSYGTMHSSKTERQKLLAHSYMYYQDFLLVSDREGVNGLNFATASDPRVPIEGTGMSRADQRTPRLYFRKYNSSTAPVTVASGVEARLIEAEAALHSGNTALWLRKLNDVRALYGMTPLVDPGTAPARVDLLFRERAFSLFATAHRLGDLRRLVRQYGRGSESVFPTGTYHKDNLTRGKDVNIAVPSSELNNPKFTGCLNRGA